MPLLDDIAPVVAIASFSFLGAYAVGVVLARLGFGLREGVRKD